MMGMSRMLFSFLSAQYGTQQRQVRRFVQRSFGWPRCGSAPQLSTARSQEALIQWTVTLADIPCGGCPTLAILVMFVGMEIGSVGMPGARYLSQVLLSFNIPHTVGFIGLAVIHRDCAIAAHDTNAGTPTEL